MVCTFQMPNTDRPIKVELECACLDPKGGELCLNKVKPGETQVEACSDADVQIARKIWVSERKTHRKRIPASIFVGTGLSPSSAYLSR